MTTINWGILGSASIARKALIPAIQKEEFSNLYAIASRQKNQARQLAKEYDFNCYYGDYQQLIEDRQVDAVYIPLPNSLHQQWTIKAAQNQKHILCEKPLGLNTQEVKNMIRAAEENNIKLMEAFMYRFQPFVREVKDLIEDKLGALTRIKADFCYNSTRPETDIRFNSELGGGALYDVGCYTVNLVRYLTQKKPIEVYNKFVERPGSEVDNRGMGFIRFKDNILTNVNYSMASYKAQDVEVVGQKGRLYIPGFFAKKEEKFRPLYLATEGKTETLRLENGDQYYLQVKQFVRAIREERPVPLSLEDSRRNAEVMDAMRQSAALNMTILL